MGLGLCPGDPPIAFVRAPDRADPKSLPKRWCRAGGATLVNRRSGTSAPKLLGMQAAQIGPNPVDLAQRGTIPRRDLSKFGEPCAERGRAKATVDQHRGSFTNFGPGVPESTHFGPSSPRRRRIRGQLTGRFWPRIDQSAAFERFGARLRRAVVL